jgi:Reverse transcriptase (RNA-dependent DNA polymerase).
MQTEGIDYFDTYDPVVQWSTVRLVLTLTLKNGWSTRQVDYTNAFVQADLQEEEVCIEPPRGFSGLDGVDKVLRLQKSLYGLKQAPKTFFDKLWEGLIERGFTPSKIDPCLFMKNNMICIIYVDDTILCGPDSNTLEAEI